MNHDDLLQSAMAQWSLRGDYVMLHKQWSSCYEEERFNQTKENEYMKRRLTGDQIGIRYPVIEPNKLTNDLHEYAYHLSRDTDRNRILLTEIPLRHELVTRQNLPPGKNEDIILTLLRGYRIYRIKRSVPADPTLIAIFSRMTKSWHRVGYANLGPAAVVWDARERYTDAGCYSLVDEPLGQGPEPVPDPVLQRCLILDLLPSPYRYYVALLSRRDWVNSGWALVQASGAAGLYPPEPGVPGPVALARVLNTDRKALAMVWEIVDRFGMPEGPLGETLQHMDRFRTF
jgi:hypothetical protein